MISSNDMELITMIASMSSSRNNNSKVGVASRFADGRAGRERPDDEGEVLLPHGIALDLLGQPPRNRLVARQDHHARGYLRAQRQQEDL